MRMRLCTTEVFVGDYNEKCDVYSFGIVLWEIFTTTQAFEQVSDNLPAFIHAVCDNNFRPDVPTDCPPCIAKLMTDCWQKNPRARPSFDQIVHILDDIMVEVAITDPVGKRLWLENFSGKVSRSATLASLMLCRYLWSCLLTSIPLRRTQDEVSWEDFKYALCETLQLADPEPGNLHFKCLEVILGIARVLTHSLTLSLTHSLTHSLSLSLCMHAVYARSFGSNLTNAAKVMV
jgi:serine/threonine protein kinase